MRVDVRIPADELSKTAELTALAADHGLRALLFQVPAAGPEIELRFEAEDALKVHAAVVRGTFTILAIRGFCSREEAEWPEPSPDKEMRRAH